MFQKINKYPNRKCIAQAANVSQKLQMYRTNRKCIAQAANVSQKLQMYRTNLRCILQAVNVSHQQQMYSINIDVFYNHRCILQILTNTQPGNVW